MNDIGLQLEKKEQIIRLDPRIKLFALLGINIVMMAGSIIGIEYYIRITMAMIPLFLLLVEKKWKPSIIYACFFAFASFGEGFVIPNVSGSLNIVFLFLSGFISRFAPGFMMGFYIVTSTTVSEFICGMEKIHMPKCLTIPISVMFRFFPTIAEENRSIAAAMRMRGIGSKHDINIFKLLEFRIVPIMMSTVKIGDELSAASLTKGLGGNDTRTNYCKIGFGVWDGVLFLVVSIGFILFCVF